MRRHLSVALTLVLAGCAAQRVRENLGDEYAELVQLRGATLTMLESHRIDRAEAEIVAAMLDQARRAADKHQALLAQTELDAARAYLKSRQGQPL